MPVDQDGITYDPPWRFDPFQNIVEVHWGGRGIAVLTFSYSSDTVTDDKPFVMLGQFPSNADTLGSFSCQLPEGPDVKVSVSDAEKQPPISEYITPDMLATYLLWNYPVHLTDNDGESDIRTTTTILPLKEIVVGYGPSGQALLRDEVITTYNPAWHPLGTPGPETFEAFKRSLTIIWYMSFNIVQLEPPISVEEVTEGVPFTGTSSHFYHGIEHQMYFLNLPLIRQAMTPKPGADPKAPPPTPPEKMTFSVRSGADPNTNDAIAWELGCTTYKNELNFPDGDLPPPNSVGEATAAGSKDEGVGLEKTVVFTIDFNTLQVTTDDSSKS